MSNKCVCGLFEDCVCDNGKGCACSCGCNRANKDENQLELEINEDNQFVVGK